MPSLTPEDREQLLGPCGTCLRCRATSIRHYCRSCDEFYETCGCSDEKVNATHGDHRIYLWTPTGVVAIPNFDQP